MRNNGNLLVNSCHVKVTLFLSVLCLSAVLALGQDTNQKPISLYATNGVTHQSSACFEDYLILVSKYVSKISLYNLKSRKLLCVKELQPWTELRGKTDIYHANNCSFGSQKYKDSDLFPLLYVSHRENNEKRGVLQVFRVVPMKTQKNKDDYDSLSISLVQTIYYPEMTDKNALGSPWTVIDIDNNCMYTYSRNNRGKSANRGMCRVSKFKIPAARESREIFLNEKDILESYEVSFKAPLSQGACIHKGRMYIAQGVSPKKYLWLRVIDLKKKKLLRTIDLKKAGLPSEPEGCFIYDNHLMISTAGKRIFKINIPLE